MNEDCNSGDAHKDKQFDWSNSSAKAGYSKPEDRKDHQVGDE